MNDLIRLLPDAIANKIAAGEVIQRPASVVKELVENAVDAGSTDIKVIIKDAGKSLIRVVDNGRGMTESDARISFERHATSKLRSADDLFAISTMGFRGEALASISAVAQVDMSTRTAESDLGTRIVIEGSTIRKQEACQTAAGTVIDVKNLFFNVPARRKFLKSNPVEFKHIADEFARIALAHPSIAFSLHHNDSEIYRLGTGNMRQRAVGVLGKKYNENLVPVEESTSYVEISGFVGKPDIAKKTRGEQFLFVNSRFIKSAYLNHAVRIAFEEMLPEGTHPFYLLFLSIDAERIDVNVHPTKQEIKFEDERLIYNYLRVAVRHALGKYSVTPTLDFERSMGFSQDQQRPVAPADPLKRVTTDNARRWEMLYDDLVTQPAEQSTVTLQSDIFPDQPQLDTDQDESGETPYQIHNSLLISHIKSGVVIVDQQAAHQRILYERYLKASANQQAAIQKMLFPITVELNQAESALISEIMHDVNEMGFEVEAFGGDSVIVHGMPPELAGRDMETVIRSILDTYISERSESLGVREKLAKAIAIQAGRKRGTFMQPEERQTMMDLLFACDNPYTSPTGRKCFITLELEEILQRFK